MLNIKLPDGNVLQQESGVSVYDVAAQISKSLAKSAVAGKVNGVLVDTFYTLTQDADLQIITAKDQEGLDILRHSCTHLMAMAVQQLYPSTKITIGPVIDNGFFYDFDYEESFTPEDLVKIEKRMKELAQQNFTVSRFELSLDDAKDFYRRRDDNYKLEILESIPSDEKLSFYQQGDFIDLCRGPHAPSTGFLKAFKLMKVSGAYWRGDSNNKMLQRIYGTCWANQQDLKEYLQKLEEAEKRDHRKLGKSMDLFHLQEEAPGMIFWHPKGWRLYQIIEQYMRAKLRKNNYLEIKTPQILDRSLWEKSGHWGHYQENMFTTSSENRDYAVKPMNCPGHIQVFNQGLKSYRDLPLRLAEFGSCHRNEPSGSLHGIMRVRGFTQDDAHIFCMESQIESEAIDFINLTMEVYKDFGFEKIELKLSTRPEGRIGSDDLWDRAEGALSSAMAASGLEWELQEGEGAFYGPKIEFTLSDCLDRKWQCGTLQLDFNLPTRLGANYVSENGDKLPVVMLHRAVLGSFERFIGILLEEYAGELPLWLAPLQAVILNVSEKQAEYAQNLHKRLQDIDARVDIDLRNEKIGFKIRQHTLAKVPYLLIIGDREVETQSVTLRTRDGKSQESLSLNELEDFFIKSKLPN